MKHAGLVSEQFALYLNAFLFILLQQFTYLQAVDIFYVTSDPLNPLCPAKFDHYYNGSYYFYSGASVTANYEGASDVNTTS